MQTIADLLAELQQRGINLWVAGTQLGFEIPKGSLTPPLRAALRTRQTEILTFLQLQQQARGAATQIPPAPRDLPLFLSFAQQRLWFLAQMAEQAHMAYQIALPLRFSGPLDLPTLRKSLQTLLERHEILRTTFRMVAD